MRVSYKLVVSSKYMY